MLVAMTNTDHAAADALSALGFTEIEARVYCELLRSAPSTGYRLAQAVGKAPANTYQALAALQQKGAVMVDDGEAKSFRPVPPSELLSALGRRFEERRAGAAEALEKLSTPAADDRIYQIKSAAQALERARAMIAAAREIVLFDLFPEPLEALRPDLERAAARGVRTAGVLYRDPGSAAFAWRIASGSAFALDHWPGSQMTLVADAREHLVALLSRDGAGVRHGVWSDSVYLGCMQHNALAAELRLADATTTVAGDLADLSLLRSSPPGLRALVGPGAPIPVFEGDAA